MGVDWFIIDVKGPLASESIESTDMERPRSGFQTRLAAVLRSTPEAFADSFCAGSIGFPKALCSIGFLYAKCLKPQSLTLLVYLNGIWCSSVVL